MKDNNEMKYKENGINKNTYDLLFTDKDNIRERDKEEEIRDYILYIIETYTRFREKSIFISFIKKYFGAKTKFDFSRIVWNEENEEYEFEYLGEKYTFDKISNSIDDKKSEKELESEKRYRHCHLASIGMAVGMINNNVLTGYTNVSGGRYLHSVIETKNGKIIDWTRNLVMPKDEYIKLTGFRVLESIKSEELLEILSKLYNKEIVGSKVVSVFGKELLNDIKRNPDIFKDDEEFKKRILEIREENEKQIGERD